MAFDVLRMRARFKHVRRDAGLVKGVYCLVVILDRPVELRVGSLGVVHFPQGTYAYVGSAMGGVEKRVGRHVSKEKKLNWHIDYLLEDAEVVATLAIPSETKEAECSMAIAIAASGDASCPAKGFGSSDCNCESHLFHFEEMGPEEALELLSLRLSALQCIYPRSDSARPVFEDRRAGAR